MQALSSMRWSRHFMIGVLRMAAASCIIRIAVFNTFRSGIPNAWQRQASSRPSGMSVTATITRSQKRSTVSTRPRSSIGVDHGGAKRQWNSPLLNGSTGPTTAAFWSPSGISRQPRPKNDTTPCWTCQPWPHNLNQTVSGKAGAVQSP